LFVLLAAVLVSCATSQPLSSEDKIDPEVVEAVARYHFSNDRYSADKAYLKVAGQDPSDALLRNFEDLDAEVLPGSKHKIGTRPYMFEILDVETKPEAAVVDAQDYFDGFFWIRYRFELRQQNGQWVVEDAYKLER